MVGEDHLNPMQLCNQSTNENTKYPDENTHKISTCWLF